MDKSPTLMPISTAPPWADRFLSDDLDEVRSFVTRSFAEHSRVAHRAGALGWGLAWVAGHAAKVAWGRSIAEQTIRGMVPDPTLHLVIPSGNVYQVGRRRLEPGRSDAMFLAPGWEFTRRWVPGLVVALTVDASRLASEVDARAPGRGRPAFRTQLVAQDGAGCARLVQAVEDFVTSARPGAGPEELAHADARMVTAVAEVLLDQAAVSRADTIAASRLARLEDWIDAHLEQPFTVGQLCEVAGVGERSLQKAFESRRGMSPMRFVAERRLAQARRRLESGARRQDVTRVALGLGFHHMGRFAKDYREAFGEAPSRTLQRAGR